MLCRSHTGVWLFFAASVLISYTEGRDTRAEHLPRRIPMEVNFLSTVGQKKASRTAPESYKNVGRLLPLAGDERVCQQEPALVRGGEDSAYFRLGQPFQEW